LFILDHNFWNRNARKSVCTRTQFPMETLVKYLIPDLAPTGSALGQVTRVKMTQ